MHLIPIHHEYSIRERHEMWHTREEFMTMVEKNLDEMYEEMDREYELQMQAEMEENEAMLLEEERQRDVEKHKITMKPPIKVRSPYEIRATYLKNLGIKHGKHIVGKKKL